MGVDLQQDEDSAHPREGQGQAAPCWTAPDQDAHRDREHRGQHAPQDQRRPPCQRRAAVSLRQHAKEFPFIALTQAFRAQAILRSMGGSW
jgi:hypothetical protein